MSTSILSGILKSKYRFMNKKIKYYILIILFFIIGLFLGYFVYQQTNKRISKDSDTTCFQYIMDERYCEQKLDSISENPEKLLLDSVVYKGNKDAYDELFVFYMKKKKVYEFLPIALLMSNKYNYDLASLDVFLCLHSFNLDKSKNKYFNYFNLDNLDENTRSLAIGYLKKASNEGNAHAKEILAQYYLKGLYLEKNIELGNQLMREVQ